MSTPLALTFRPATPEDAVAVTGLLNQLNQAEGNSTVMQVEDTLRGLFAEQRPVNLRALLAVAGEQIVGAALYYTGYDILTAVIGYHLGDLVVDASCRRSGVGERLFAALAQQNLDEGGEWISLTALRHNAPALAFYDKLGMIRMPVEFFAVGEVRLRALIARVAK